MSEADLWLTIIEAIGRIQKQIRWKPGKDIEHLERRIKKGHLPVGTTLGEYEAIIKTVVNCSEALVYSYDWEGTIYAAVVTDVNERRWLVMMSPEGVMETAFVIDTKDYLEGIEYTLLGTLQGFEA